MEIFFFLELNTKFNLEEKGWSFFVFFFFLLLLVVVFKVRQIQLRSKVHIFSTESNEALEQFTCESNGFSITSNL